MKTTILWLRSIVLAALMPVTLAHADFALQPGDRVRTAIIGIGDASIEAMVDMNGAIDLGVLGSHAAANLSIDELEQAVRNAAAGLIVKLYDREGELYIIQLSGDEIQVIRDGYRAVVVGGDIATPGELVFRPGLTVREVVALSGGVKSNLLTEDATVDPIQLVRWRGDFATAALRHATAKVLLWRLSAQLEGSGLETPPPLSEVSVTPDVLEQLVNEQVKIAESEAISHERQISYFKTALAESYERSEILARQQEQLASALASDEAELDRQITLLERGLVPEAKVADARRVTSQAATRLLDVAEDLASSNLASIRLERDLQAADEDRQLDRLIQIDVNQNTIKQAEIQMNVLSQFLAGGTETTGLEDLIAPIDYAVSIYRRENGVQTRIIASQDAQVLPGDVVDVEIVASEGGTAALTD